VDQSQIVPAVKQGLKTLFSSITFFYSHLILVVLSLIPSTFRAIQMWHELNTPVILEIIVECTRVILFILMISLLSQLHLKELFNKPVLNTLMAQWSQRLKANWPHTTLAQIAVFIIVLYFLANLLISTIVNITIEPLMALLKISSENLGQAEEAYRFFFKNMTIIPLAMVFTLKIFGAGPANESKSFVHFKGCIE
jgi:hypothetical protein